MNAATAMNSANALPAQGIVGYMPMPVGFSHKETFLHGRPLHQKYDAFFLRHPPMKTGHRAKIFSPFDALRGFDFCIMQMEMLYTQKSESCVQDIM